MADRLASDEPRRLADFLRENREQILAHWEAEVRKVRAARQLERPLLLDHVPEFIEDLAEYVDELRTGHDVAPPEDQPRIHALERLEVGGGGHDVHGSVAAKELVTYPSRTRVRRPRHLWSGPLHAGASGSGGADVARGGLVGADGSAASLGCLAVGLAGHRGGRHRLLPDRPRIPAWPAPDPLGETHHLSRPAELGRGPRPPAWFPGHSRRARPGRAPRTRVPRHRRGEIPAVALRADQWGGGAGGSGAAGRARLPVRPVGDAGPRDPLARGGRRGRARRSAGAPLGLEAEAGAQAPAGGERLMPGLRGGPAIPYLY